MVAKLIRLTHKIAIQLYLGAESCTIICSSRSRLPVRKLLDTPSYAAGLRPQEYCTQTTVQLLYGNGDQWRSSNKYHKDSSSEDMWV